MPDEEAGLAPWLDADAPPAGSNAPALHVVFAQDVIDDIRAHGRATPDVEVCGVLVGNVYQDDDGSGCYVAANIRGNGAEGRNAQVTFTSDTWAHINTMMDTKYADERIVGWYHTHPGFGIFLSEMDLFIHQNFFGEPWQIAYVDDPQGGDCGVFVWEKGALVRRPLRIEPRADEGPKNARPARWRRMTLWAVLVLFVLGLLIAAALVWGHDTYFSLPRNPGGGPGH
jgi:proteasome lid subunit RPN8/RPN11